MELVRRTDFRTDVIDHQYQPKTTRTPLLPRDGERLCDYRFRRLLSHLLPAAKVSPGAAHASAVRAWIHLYTLDRAAAYPDNADRHETYAHAHEVRNCGHSAGRLDGCNRNNNGNCAGQRTVSDPRSQSPFVPHYSAGRHVDISNPRGRRILFPPP